MSDDFDNLRPPGDEDEDDLPDWQSDESGEKGKSSSGDSLGFTGELNWRQDVDDAFNDQLEQSDDDRLEWQKDQPAEQGSTGSSFGFTGELDWKKLRPDDESEEGDILSADWLTEDTDPSLLSPEEDEPADDDNPMTWMNPAAANLFPVEEAPVADDEEDPFALPPLDDDAVLEEDDDPFALPPIEAVEPGSDDPLSWLQQYSAEDEPETAGDEPAEKPEIPSWLDDAETSDDEAALDDAPPWLQDVPVAEKPMSEGGKLSDDWLAGAENAPETASSDMTFDQWQQIQDEMTRPRDSDEEMPDLFSELGGELASDDLPTSETGELPSWVLGMDELDTSDAPEWFTGDEGQELPPETDEAPAAVANDDIFAELGLPSFDTGYDFLDNPQVEASAETPDWFQETEGEVEADPNAPPDWLGELGDLSEMRAASRLETGSLQEIEEPDDDDFFGGLPDLPPAQPAEINPLDTSKLQDIDSLLASYEYNAPLPSTGELVAGSAELDKLFSDAEVESIEVKRRSELRPGDISGLSPDAPDWLTELGASVEEVSAAAIVRKQTQREKPLDELSDRLQALHDRGLDLPATEDIGSSDVLKTLLPGVNEVLSTTSINTSQSDRTGDLMLSDVQRRKIDLLKTLVGTGDDKQVSARPSAIDLTLATPNLDDMAGLDDPDFSDSKAPSAARSVSRDSRRRWLPKFDRLVIALLVTLAVGLPFLSPPARIGDLPPAQFAAGSRQQAVFDRVNAVGGGELVLVAAEYGPTGAGELDTSLDALLRHILLRGARPVIVSGNAVGLLHARNILDEIAGDPDFLAALDRPQIQSGRDFYVARYIAASAVGLRAFSEDIPRLLSVDVNGQPTGIQAESLRDFELIVIVAENAEDVRAWAEQVAPLAGYTLVAATGQSAAPLAEPYVMSEAPQRLSGLGGMLVGYRDAYTYRTMVDAGLFSGAAAPTETLAPTETPLPIVETTAEPEALTTDEATVTSDPDVSPTADRVAATATLRPSSTPSPTFTSTPTDTPSPTATQTPISTTAPGVVIRAVVDASQAVNVRERPGRTFTPIAAVSPGAIVQVIGRNGDGEWIQIRLEDGGEGWIAAELLAIEEPVTVTPDGEASPTVESARNMDFMFVSLISDVNFVPMFQDEVTPEATAEATEEAAEATSEATSEAIVETGDEPLDSAISAASLQSTSLYREERWYGMTLGLVAIILIITVGMIANILRGLFRRRKL